MPMRNFVYLDAESLMAHAEYNEIQVPRQEEVVERSREQRSREAGLRLRGTGVGGGSGFDVEYQSTYRLEPNEKATVNRVLDRLVHESLVLVDPDGSTSLSKDDLVEVDGTTQITTASAAGKMLYILRQLMASEDLALDDLSNLDVTDIPDFTVRLKRAYLDNELLPLPILLEMRESTLPQRVYVHVNPDNFIDSASVGRVEGRLRVLGTVRQLIPEGNEGFLSSEEWLLHDWEYMVKRLLMPKIDPFVRDMMTTMDVALPEDDVRAYLTGPAILIDAIAFY